MIKFLQRCLDLIVCMGRVMSIADKEFQNLTKLTYYIHAQLETLRMIMITTQHKMGNSPYITVNYTVLSTVYLPHGKTAIQL